MSAAAGGPRGVPGTGVGAGAWSHEEAVVISAPANGLYDLVSDVTRTGEWSPICTACSWDDPEDAGRVGAWFTGHNELPERTWETRSQVVVAERGREFAWLVGGAYVRWGFRLAPVASGTELTESWHFLPEGLTMFAEKYGDGAPEEIEVRTGQALDGIPRTLARIRAIAESSGFPESPARGAPT